MDDFRNTEKLFSVNWEDGMLVRAAHLIEQEKYYEYLNRWVVEHTPHLFGLTGPTPWHKSSLDLRLDHDGQNWLVVITRCYGMTVSGRIIQIDNILSNEVRSVPVTTGSGDKIPVYLHVKREKRGVGNPSGQDEPTRHPHRAFDYEVIAGELREIDPADCLKVGEIKYSEGRPALSADYIPPCMVIGSHPLLAEQCRRLSGLLTLVQQNAVSGFQAFVAVAQDKPGKFGIEHRWFQDMLSGLAIQIGGMLRAHPTPDLPMAPYDLIRFYRQVFGIVDSMLDTYRESSLILKKKFGDNEAFKRFLSGIKETGDYNHYDLGPETSRLIKLMNDFVEFINLIKSLAGALPQEGLIMNYRNREYRLQQFSTIHSLIDRDSVTVKIDGLGNCVSRDILVGLHRDLFSGVDYRYIMVKIGINENNIPGRMDPVYVDAEASSGNLLLKPMDDLAEPAIGCINLNFRGNFNPQDLKSISNDMVNVYIY
jgi:hypothetical protein